MSVLVESKRVRPEFFHSKFCDRRRCRAVNALTAAAATLSRHFRDSFRAGGVTSKAKPVSASGYFLSSLQKSLTFRISGLLFGACCFFVCGGAEYFLGRATFLRLGWIRWCGLLFGRGRNTFNAKAESVLKPQMVKNLVKTKPYPNPYGKRTRTESVPNPT